jgi:hypothetical protein
VPKGPAFAISIGKGVVFHLYSFHSHAAKNTRESNVSHEKPMLAILVPSIASFCLLISLSAYLWLKKRAKKGTTRHSNLYLIYYSAFLVGRSSHFDS